MGTYNRPILFKTFVFSTKMFLEIHTKIIKYEVKN